MATKQEEALARYKALAVGKKGQPLEDGTIILLGAQSTGKTTLGASASDDCPDALPAKEMTELTDIGYVPIEAGGLDALRGNRLTIPAKNVVPFPEVLGDTKHPVEAMCISVDLLKSFGVTKALFDSLSKFDGLLQGWLETPEGKKLWEGDKFKKFAYSYGAHQVVALKIAEFSGLKLLVFHPQADMSDIASNGQAKSENALKQDEAYMRKEKAAGTIAQADLTLGVTGKARELWPKDASLILGLQQVKDNGVYVREILTQFDEKSGLAVKSRFEGILPPRLRNTTLKAMIKTIRDFK